jgi:hypothetical protein
MEHRVDVRVQRSHRLVDVLPDEPVARPVHEQLLRVARARRQVVDADHLGPLRQQAFAEMTADETGSTEHHDLLQFTHHAQVPPV